MAATLPKLNRLEAHRHEGQPDQPVMPCEETPRPGILGMTMRKHVML